jgi:exodeoxyribonuclease V gamma subunit
MPIDVYESTRFEPLWERFLATVAQPQSSPLAIERIVIPGRGWETWFNQRLAAEFGCWAQFQFQAPGRWVGESLSQLLGPELAPNREPDALIWEMAALLPELCRDSDFGAVRGYLASAGDSDPRQLIDLSRCVAGLFDRYLLYRPELIEAWEDGRLWPHGDVDVPAHAAWQRTLWLRIKERRGFRCVRAMVNDLRQRLDNGQVESHRLPERVSVWLSGGIAPVHLAFLEAIGRHSSVAVYSLTPASEFWGDMRGRRQMLRQLRDSPKSLSEFCRENHLDLLHPLLASMGNLSRQQQMLMVDCDAEPWMFHEVDESERGNEVFEETLLGTLQSDVALAGEPQRRELPNDKSVRIHSCHTAMREIEVLRDQIRGALEADPNLAPEDIAVFCPDMPTYAPLIRAVFGVTEAGCPGHIPFHLAGQSLHRTRPIIDAFFRLLDTLGGRFEASSVLDLLSVEPIGSAAGLSRDDVSKVGEWIADAGVRWGLDADHRQAEDLPGSDQNTWRTGLDRLLLGYAMPPGEERLVGDVLTLDRAEGLDGVLLGRLWAFLSRLRNWRDRMSDPRPLANWREPLTGFARLFLDESTDDIGLQRLFDALDDLLQLAQASRFTQPLPLAVVSRELSRQVESTSGGAGVRVGGVTFCGLDDLRALPFRVIGLIGMNDGAFPRSDRSLRFDLTTEHAQPGDRTPRDEDRHLFLEALLAARSQIIITFQGQSERDQKQRPAASVVEELLDAIERTDAESTESGVGARDVVFIRHPLQRFSPRYFDAADSRLFGFDRNSLAAAERLNGDPAAVPAFAIPLQHGADPIEEIRVHDLRRLLERPWTLFLERLGVSLHEQDSAVADREPFVLDALERWGIGDRWLNGRLSGESTEELSGWLLRSGKLPAGALGRRALDDLNRQADEVLRHTRAADITSVGERLSIDLEFSDVRIVGDIDGWSAQTIRRATFSKISPKRAPRLWLDTVLATVARQQKCGNPAVLVGRSDNSGGGHNITIHPPTLAAARSTLQEFITLFRAARETPLPLFPEAMAVVIKELRREPNCLDGGELESQVIRRARQAYEGTQQQPGSSQQPAVQSAFAGLDPFSLTCSDVPSFARHGWDAGSQNLFANLTRRICLDIVNSPFPDAEA